MLVQIIKYHRYIVAKCEDEMGLYRERWLPKISEKEISKRGGHPGTHGCAVNLEVVVIIKTKIIHGENHAN